jgi:Tol biopolymer transport system component
VRWFVLCALAGCSFHVHDAPGDGPSDAPVDTARDAVDGAPQPDCLARWRDHTIEFAMPVALSVNGTGYDRDPFLSPDELTIYFSTVRTGTQPPGQADVYTATRATIGDPFGTPSLYAFASTTDGSETKLSFTGDGLDLVVGSSKPGGKGQVDVWEAVKSATWGPLQQSKLGAVNDFANQQDPTISGDGLTLYEAPDTSGTQQIMVATRQDRSHNFTAPQQITELVDPGGFGTADPAVSVDQRIIVVSSGRLGGAGQGDLWYATRPSVNDPFEAPIPVPGSGVNTPANEGDAHLSADGCRLYFASDRDVGMDWDLFVATAR